MKLMKNQLIKIGKIYLLSHLLFVQNGFAFEKIKSLILGNVVDQSKYKLTDYVENDIDAFVNFEKTGDELFNSCSWVNKPRYISEQQKNTDVMNYLASFQYASLNSISKNIAILASKNNFSEAEFRRFSNNLVTNFCSENLSIISKKELENNLNLYFNIIERPETNKPLGPYNPLVVSFYDEKKYIENQLNAAVSSFRSICSWGGKPSDLGLLNPFIKNEYVMGDIIKKIGRGVKDFPTVVCENLICRSSDLRKNDRVEFLATMRSYYCHYFNKYPKRPRPENATLKKWNELTTDDDINLHISQLISSLNNQPNILAISEGDNNRDLYMSSFDHYFRLWSEEKISYFSNHLLFEEKLSVRPSNTTYRGEIRSLNFQIDFGEIDQSKNSIGKVTTHFDFIMDKKLVDYIYREVSFPTNWSLKKEKVLQKVIKEHLVQASKKTYHKYFYFLNKDVFYDLISSQVYENITSESQKSNVEFNGHYRIQFYFGHFALSYIRNLKRSIN